MKQTHQKSAVFLLIAAFILTLVLGALAAPSTAAITAVTDYAALTAAVNGVAMPDAPQGATDVQYSVLKGEQPIAQIRFTFDGAVYHFRASACKDAALAGDISGMKAVFGTDGMQTVAGAGGEYKLGLKGKNGLIQWFSEGKLCQYSLLTDAAKDADSLQAFADTLRASAEAVATPQSQGTRVDGTVTKVSKTSITLLDQDGAVFTFTISGRTVNMDAKSIKKKSTVRVNYSGTYAEGCEAISITLTTDASSGGSGGGSGKSHSGGSSGKATSKPTATPKPSRTPKPTATPNPAKKFSLSGTVTMMYGNAFEIQTAKGDLAAFLIEDAEVKGGDNAAVGDKANVTYNVVKDAAHLLSVTFQHTEPSPTPAPPTEHQEGVIVDRDDTTLTLLIDDETDMMDFDISTAKLQGDLDAGEGDYAEVTYTMLPGGQIATVVVFTKAEPDPTDVPDPTDEPDDVDDAPDTGNFYDDMNNASDDQVFGLSID